MNMRVFVAMLVAITACGGIDRAAPCDTDACRDVAQPPTEGGTGNADGAMGSSSGAGGDVINARSSAGAGGAVASTASDAGAGGDSGRADASGETADSGVADVSSSNGDAGRDVDASHIFDAVPETQLTFVDASSLDDAEVCEAGHVLPVGFPGWDQGRRCVGEQPQLCVGSAWSNVGSACTPGMCKYGSCCALSCQGRVSIRICALDLYEPIEECPTVCVQGKCTECLPGDRKCTGDALQICDFDGQWHVLTTCPLGCSDAGVICFNDGGGAE